MVSTYEQNRRAQVKYLSDPAKKAAHYARTRARNQQYEAKLYEFMRLAKASPCLDCGQEFHFSAMDFDHVRGEKLMDVSMMVRRRYSLTRIKDEIAKCDLVCSNCHRVRTWTRRQTTTSSSG